MAFRSVLLLFLLLPWGRVNAQLVASAPDVAPHCHVDTAQYVIFTTSSSSLRPLIRRKVVLFQLSPGEVDRAECILQAFHDRCRKGGQAFVDSLSAKDKGACSPHFDRIDLGRALRQYIGGIDVQGHELVYVNSLCPPDAKGWRSQWVPGRKNDVCSFRAVVDLTLGNIEVLSVSGPG
jgi:hypothetical protein